MSTIITKLQLRWNISQENRSDRPAGRGINLPGQDTSEETDAQVDRRPQTAPHCLFVDLRSALTGPTSMYHVSETISYLDALTSRITLSAPDMHLALTKSASNAPRNGEMTDHHFRNFTSVKSA